MKKLVLALVVAITMSSALMVTLSVTTMAADSAKQQVCDGIGATVDKDSCTSGSGKSLNDIASVVINVFSWIVGIVAVLFAIIAGFKYITSGGDPSAIKSAKDTLLYVIIGLIIVAISQIIVNFVLDKTNNIDKPATSSTLQLKKVV